MGFSVSGSAAIIFAGMLIAFGMWHSAATNSFEQIEEARDDRADAALEQQNTAIEIQSATNTTEGSTSYRLDLTVTNNGTTSLSLTETEILLDNVLQTGWESDATVDGDGDTDLWLPGETLAYSVTYDDQNAVPNRVMVATEGGISDSSEVTDV